MAITVKCGACGFKFAVPNSMGGDEVACRQCQEVIEVPLPKASSPPPVQTRVVTVPIIVERSYELRASDSEPPRILATLGGLALALVCGVGAYQDYGWLGSAIGAVVGWVVGCWLGILGSWFLRRVLPVLILLVIIIGAIAAITGDPKKAENAATPLKIENASDTDKAKGDAKETTDPPIPK